ncbi:hypothetical protein BD410DRAFT_343950 [Rickenella mellea]|uniref:Uncharacterized protein n=1 Tax=Rickenella mellea TaxID=50990 RepID=A0A4Y7QL05_9AGAM|nr:hypothetical protein BD410DRAFT_343950 [Rickenella mellea]
MLSYLQLSSPDRSFCFSNLSVAYVSLQGVIVRSESPRTLEQIRSTRPFYTTKIFRDFRHSPLRQVIWIWNFMLPILCRRTKMMCGHSHNG